MKYYLALIFCLLVSFSTLAFSESYEESKWYKDYIEMPDKYKTPEMEKLFRDGYKAELKVKQLPCTHGGTVNQYLNNKASIPAVEDLGWITKDYEGGFNVERLMLLNKKLQLIYRWRVNPDGTVTPKNGKAISITK